MNEQTEHLIADEFSAELAEGVAYVSGHDEESRPVVVIPLTNFLFFLFFFISFFVLSFGSFRFSGLNKTTRSCIHRNCKCTQKAMKQILSIFYFYFRKLINFYLYFLFLRFTRLLVFTLEVAIQTMTKNVEQFVLLFDASKPLTFPNSQIHNLSQLSHS